MGAEILSDERPCATPLPEEKYVDECKLEDTLEVGSKQGQPCHHTKQNGKEDR